ncbi:MAG: hypothetical protein AAB662_03800 [Patescibacteria group bacterium]|mgnify:FL=1
MKLILLYGPPAVGKLTVAKQLSKTTGISLLHSHMMLNDIAQIFGYDNPIRKKLEFEFKTRIMEEAVGERMDIITTGSITRDNSDYYRLLMKLVKEKNGTVFLVQFKAGKEALFDRVKHESRKEKINSVEKLEEFFKKYPENLEKFGEGEQLVIDTTRLSPEESAQLILKQILS